MPRKILLLSDTHGFIDEKVLNYCKDADEVWHAGDIGNLEVINKIEEVSKVKAVYGNIDDKNPKNTTKKRQQLVMTIVFTSRRLVKNPNIRSKNVKHWLNKLFLLLVVRSTI